MELTQITQLPHTTASSDGEETEAGEFPAGRQETTGGEVRDLSASSEMQEFQVRARFRDVGQSSVRDSITALQCERLKGTAPFPAGALPRGDERRTLSLLLLGRTARVEHEDRKPFIGRDGWIPGHWKMLPIIMRGRPLQGWICGVLFLLQGREGWLLIQGFQDKICDGFTTAAAESRKRRTTGRMNE